MASGKRSKKAAPKSSKSRTSKSSKSRSRPAPAAADPVIEPGKTVALVKKGHETVPVQLKDQAHLDKLRDDFGHDSVQVQP